MNVSRRAFLKTSLSGLAYFTTASTVPLWVAKSAAALSKQLTGDRILVILQQAGGNDGLNTVIPYTDELYLGNSLRPNLHILSGTPIDSLNALHPKLARLNDWFTEGNVAIVQNVGYPNPNLSHFVATDYWELGTSTGAALQTAQGWASRYFDNQCAGVPPETIHALTLLSAGTASVPLTLYGSLSYTPPAVPKFSSYIIEAPSGAQGTHRKNYIQALSETASLNGDIDFLHRSAVTAQASVADIATASQQPTLNVYPATSLGAGLDIVSKVIRGGFPTKVFYVSQGGYDTHSNQVDPADPANVGDHADLLDELDQAVNAFLLDMAQSGLLDRVVLMTFSEFGRRVGENGSSGTDHGTANCLFVMGGNVKGGVYGGQPDLANLQGGNLDHRIDFRSVYSRVMTDWLAVDPESIFGTEDFTDPVFNIQGGMTEIPIFDVSVTGDVDGDGAVDATDVQRVVNGALDLPGEYNTDLNNDSKTDAVDIQLVINAVLNG